MDPSRDWEHWNLKLRKCSIHGFSHKKSGSVLQWSLNLINLLTDATNKFDKQEKMKPLGTWVVIFIDLEWNIPRYMDHEPLRCTSPFMFATSPETIRLAVFTYIGNMKAVFYTRILLFPSNSVWPVHDLCDENGLEARKPVKVPRENKSFCKDGNYECWNSETILQHNIVCHRGDLWTCSPPTYYMISVLYWNKANSFAGSYLGHKAIPHVLAAYSRCFFLPAECPNVIHSQLMSHT